MPNVNSYTTFYTYAEIFGNGSAEEGGSEDIFGAATLNAVATIVDFKTVYGASSLQAIGTVSFTASGPVYSKFGASSLAATGSLSPTGSAVTIWGMGAAALGAVGSTSISGSAHGAGTGNFWVAGTPYLILGPEGYGRLEFAARSGFNQLPRFTMLLQGATYNTSKEIYRLGDMAFWGGYGSNPGFGFGIGEYAPGIPNMTWDPTNGLRLSIYDTPVLQLDTLGNAYIQGVLNIGDDGGIFQGDGDFASPETGYKLYNSAGIGLWEMWGNSVKQVYANTDGQLVAGAGQILLDQFGESFAYPAIDLTMRRYPTGDYNRLGHLFHYAESGDPGKRTGKVRIESIDDLGGEKCTNGSFETNTTGWTASNTGSSTITATRANTQAYDGLWAARLAVERTSTTSITASYTYTAISSIAAGEWIRFGLFWKLLTTVGGDEGGTEISLKLLFRNVSNTVLSTVITSMVDPNGGGGSSSGWEYIFAEGLAPATTDNIVCSVEVVWSEVSPTAGPVTVADFYIDRVSIYQHASQPAYLETQNFGANSDATVYAYPQISSPALVTSAIVNNAIKYTQGSSFPASPTNGDIHWHTTHLQWCFYKSSISKWLSCDILPFVWDDVRTTGIFPNSTPDNTIIISGIFDLDIQIYLDYSVHRIQVQTTNGVSDFWVITHVTSSNDGTATTLTTIDTSDPLLTADQNYRLTSDLNVLLDNNGSSAGNELNTRISIATTGTPGTLIYSCKMYYRYAYAP